MEDCVLLRIDGDILAVPVSDLANPKLVSWWSQTRPPYGEDKAYAYAKAAWMRYSALTGQFDGWRPLKRSKRQLWLRSKLTKWGVI